jgi:hypothetical protein
VRGLVWLESICFWRLVDSQGGKLFVLMHRGCGCELFSGLDI